MIGFFFNGGGIVVPYEMSGELSRGGIVGGGVETSREVGGGKCRGLCKYTRKLQMSMELNSYDMY